MESRIQVLRDIIEILLNPSVFFSNFESNRKRWSGYFLAMMLISVVLVPLSRFCQLESMPWTGSISLEEKLLDGLISWLPVPFLTLYLGLVHLFIKLLGGKGSILDTYQSAVYSLTPIYLFSWTLFYTVMGFSLPAYIVYMIILFPSVWSVAIFVIAIHHVHKISKAGSFISAFPLMLVPVLLIVLMLTWLQPC